MEFSIVKFGKVLEAFKNGWSLEINLVSWYGKDARWEIRSWNSDHTLCGKGVAISEAALLSMKDYLNETYSNEEVI